MTLEIDSEDAAITEQEFGPMPQRLDDHDYVQIGSQPLAEWLEYWTCGNQSLWNSDKHDVSQLQQELCEASGYVQTLLRDIAGFMRHQETRQPYPGEIDNAMLAAHVDSLKDDFAMENEAHKSALNRNAELRDTLEEAKVLLWRYQQCRRFGVGMPQRGEGGINLDYDVDAFLEGKQISLQE